MGVRGPDQLKALKPDSSRLTTLSAQLGAAGWQVTQVSEESLSTLGAASRIDGYAASIGDVVVVALGNNDGATPAQFAGWIDAVMSHLQSARRVYWLTMREFRSWVPAANAAFRWVKDVLGDEADAVAPGGE